uniref:RNA-directed RNA polymerase catalytic subunit n=1 Tax=Guadeloupe mosquito quaranja-like virus 3 TaxID=2607739 RepID=A0A5C1K486_9ORTO|nr:PB1 [Guadeloupe mosquito quaranja-like virus 3]
MMFEDYPNSFFDAVFGLNERMDINKPRSGPLTNLNSISALYQYTNPPPMGYGTPAPKVVETVTRAYGMNKNDEDKREIIIDGYKIEHTAWSSTKPFPWFEPASNFCVPTLYAANVTFLNDNFNHIRDTVEQEVTRMMSQNSDILTRGRQTYCPLTESSLPCPRAYKNMMEFLCKNGSLPNLSVFQLIAEFFRILGKRYVIGKKVEYVMHKGRKSTAHGHMRTTKIRKLIKWKKYEGDEAYHYTLGLARSFCTYLKHGERAHLKRRAIASPNIIKRAFLFIIESVHLALGKVIEGSTISIGGEEKKDKIIQTMESLITDNYNREKCQATEDATKWNETLSASLFGVMHKTWFDNTVRRVSRLPECTEFELLYARVCEAAHFLLAIKRVTLGPGLQGRAASYHGAIPYTEEGLEMVNSLNKPWFEEMLKLREGNNYIRASPGMLMGMMNAGSTTLGLITVNYYHDGRGSMKTLRSSDDSMTIHAGPDRQALKVSMDKQYCEMKVSAISLSPKKTLIFANKYGEFTSWFQDGKLVSQFGPETTTLRPAGQNPHDDFYLAAKNVSVSLLNCASNPIGAEIKLALGVSNVRSLYRIQLRQDDEIVSRLTRVLADGGYNCWDVGNCHLEETSLKMQLTPPEYRGYFNKIRDPRNPFATSVEEQTYYDKELGALQVDFLDNPRTVFSYSKRGNRASIQKVAGSNAESERAAQQALEIITSLDHTTTLITPREATLSGVYCVAGMMLLREGLDLDSEEDTMYRQALSVLLGEHQPNEDIEEEEFALDEDSS